MDLESTIRQYDFNLAYAQALVADLSPAQMTTVPAKGFENHAAFTLGHLVTGSALCAKYLGGAYELPDGWSDLFLRRGPGDPRMPLEDVKAYPSREALLKELERQHELVKELLLVADAAVLEGAFKWRFSERMPRLIDAVTFLCVNHEAMHLGQLAGWRRALGLESALGGM